MKNAIVISEEITSKIINLRDAKVMIDQDLAILYGVTTANLNKAVKRNLNRFPDDFMFRLTVEEAASLRFQNGTSKGRGGRRYLPYAFTEHGVAMLSSVLKSERAILVNIHIMRVFGKINELLPNYKKLVSEFEDLKKKVAIHDDRLEANFKSIMYILKNLPRNTGRS